MWFVLVTQVTLIYIYVDNYVVIPEAWSENMKKFCKNIRLTETFHHNNVVAEGYMVTLPVFFFWKALENSQFGKKLYFDISHLQHIKVGFKEFVVRCAMAYSIDFLFTQIIPINFYGTKDLDIYSDWFFKRFCVMGFISSLPGSPVENYV